MEQSNWGLDHCNINFNSGKMKFNCATSVEIYAGLELTPIVKALDKGTAREQPQKYRSYKRDALSVVAW